MLTCKTTLPDSPHPVIISKIPGFRALYLARQNEFRFFRLINTKNIFFSFLAVGFCPKNLAFARKIMALPSGSYTLVRFGLSRSFKVIDFGTNRKPCVRLPISPS